MTHMKHDLQQQHYKTCYWHDPHKAWSPDSKNITRHTAGTTHMKHGLQTATKLQDLPLALPDSHKAWSLANRILRHIIGKPSRVTYRWKHPQRTSLTILCILLNIPCTIVMRLEVYFNSFITTVDNPDLLGLCSYSISLKQKNKMGEHQMGDKIKQGMNSRKSN